MRMPCRLWISATAQVDDAGHLCQFQVDFAGHFSAEVVDSAGLFLMWLRAPWHRNISKRLPNPGEAADMNRFPKVMIQSTQKTKNDSPLIEEKL